MALPYCSSIIRSSGIFSGLMRQNSVPDIAQEDGDDDLLTNIL